MATQTMNYTDILAVIECGSCYISFAIPRVMQRQRLEDGRTFYCPNGHNISYHEHEVDKLRKQVDRLEDAVRWEKDQRVAAERDADTQRRSAAAAKGQLTKIRKKVENGVCPVAGCKRSFEPLKVRDHIRTVHPGYHLHEET